jgi:hypothetical protein
MELFIAIDAGQIAVTDWDTDTVTRYAPTMDGAIEFLKYARPCRGTDLEWMQSSTVDFPAESGLWPAFNLVNWINDAIREQRFVR